MPVISHYHVEIRDKDDVSILKYKDILKSLNEVVQWLHDRNEKIGEATIRNILADKIPGHTKFYHIRVEKFPQPSIKPGTIRPATYIEKIPALPKKKIVLRLQQASAFRPL